MYKHICTSNILVKEQYGFRINSYTEAASYNEINEILKAINWRSYRKKEKTISEMAKYKKIWR